MLGWPPKALVDELVVEMALRREDSKSADLDELIRKYGYKALNCHK